MPTLRTAVHLHSTWSYDGRWTLEELASRFSSLRYDALLMTEHDRGFNSDRWDGYREACRDVSDRFDLTVVPGIEYSDATGRFHVPTWGAEEFIGEALPAEDLARRLAESAQMTMLAHPTRGDACDRLDGRWLSALRSVEIWNRKYDGVAPNRRALALSKAHRGLLPVVGLDFHSGRQLAPLVMEIFLDGTRTREAIVEAFAAGSCRAMAFGIPAERLSHGAVLPLLEGVDRGWKHVKRAKHGLTARGG